MMLNTQLYQPPHAARTLVPSPAFNHFIYGISDLRRGAMPTMRKRRNSVRVSFVPGSIIKAAALTAVETSSPAGETPSSVQSFTSVTAVVTVKTTITGILSDLAVGLDNIMNWFGTSLLLELVSSEIHPENGLEKATIKGYARKVGRTRDEVRYECKLSIPNNFGGVGAILVENEHHREMFIQDIVLQGLPDGPVTMTCSSWVHSKYDNPQKRIFFVNKSFLPAETPSGLQRLREEELENLRGNGQGERKKYDRIYDYDVYNDIGNPDSNIDQRGPSSEGKNTLTLDDAELDVLPAKLVNPESETKSSPFYIPRDEAFSERKNISFYSNAVYSVLHALLPALEAIADTDQAFSDFRDIDELFKKFDLPSLKQFSLATFLPRLVNAIIHFETPDTMALDSLFWFRDEEFARQTLAGVNPYAIQLVTEWPLKSKLDPAIYGQPESAITKEVVEQAMRGIMSLDEALKQKKLFMLDYHDLLLPYVSKVRQLKETTLYGSRTLFFLTPEGTLIPLAIELTRPPIDGKPEWKKVFTPSNGSTSNWLWRLAKAHVLAHDSGYHELISHWLRTHCCTEPYIIATKRQLSAMHPIHKLLHPHFRYTMAINALARGNLINSDGIIETSFSPGKYSMEISSVAYDQLWQFDSEALPKDLISRGMAVEDPTAPHGLKLTIEDYPFANDGLLIWDALKEWISDYVNHYYRNPRSVESDTELQAWWTEIRTVGHGDKKDEEWWPELKTNTDLIEILTTIAWVASGHHAAVNFGQYAYGGYFPNRPSIARTTMPEDEDEAEKIMKNPELAMMQCFPSQIQAAKVMAVLDILSSHSSDEEYLGDRPGERWEEDATINAAFERFSGRLKEIESIIDARNKNQSLQNRNGVGVLSYELLKPFSKSGVTGEGVPYSISI